MHLKHKLIALAAFVFLVVFIKNGGAIECWDCRSNEHVNCDDPFNNFTGVNTFNCLESKHEPYVKSFQCRKIIKPFNGHYQIIRGCDYNDIPLTEDVEVYYCDHHRCNSATSFVPVLLFTLLITIITAAYNIVIENNF